MKIGDHDWHLEPLGKHIWRSRMEAGQLLALARSVKGEGGQLSALWGSDDHHLGAGFAIHLAFMTSIGLVWGSCALAANVAVYPDFEPIFPQAGRMQRATFDLLGIRAENTADERKWLRHGAWGADTFPLRKGFDDSQPAINEVDEYPFVRVEGEGVHEIPVGPIHAGTIEPGHFRFSIIGERVLRLEQRLGYTHKGIEKRFEGMNIATGAKLAGRVSGDSHSAYAWAYGMAVESATASEVPVRALWLRALFLEIERVANHLGDLGYLGNDVALSFGFMQFWRLKEAWLRLAVKHFGHRYLFDCIVPGGVAVDISDNGKAELTAESGRIELEVRQLKAIYDDQATLQDRFANTGVCSPELASRLGLTGLAGRASGQARDARIQFPQTPYDQCRVNIATHSHGDVLARAEVRFVELFESLRLIRELLKAMPEGKVFVPINPVEKVCEGLGWVEGWRGEVLVAVRIGADGKLDRVHPHDPSWQNWPLLEICMLGNIVPDFPLINKSFNLSYSGPDL